MEQYRQTIYCDLDFLKSIISKQETESSSLDNSFYGDIEFATIIHNLIFSSKDKNVKKIKFYLNVSHDEYSSLLSNIDKKRLKAARKDKEPNLTPFEKQLLSMEQQRQAGILHLHINPQKIVFDNTLLQDNYLNAIFFSCESKETCQQAIKDYGVIIVSTETLNDFQYLLSDHGAAIKKSDESDWRKCLSGEESTVIPCNSLIIVDNYILNDCMEENLTPLLDAILPKSLKPFVIFELTVFAMLKTDRGSNDYCIKRRFEEIMEILGKIRPNINFSLSILKCKGSTFHDRSIASGNLFIGCGGGFNLFKNGKSQKTTTVCAFHPFFHIHNNWAHKAYSDLLNEASYVFKNASVLEDLDKQYCISNYIFGKKENRLLDQIK